MRPLSEWQPGRPVGVFTDIDDTLTTASAITQGALQALAELQSAGLHVIAVTGRPVGWCVPLAQAWPVDAIVAENGAVALVVRKGGRLDRLYLQDPATRAAHFDRMQAVAASIEAEVPGALRTRDSAGRETDIAIDHSEYTHLPASGIEAVLHRMRTAGMTTSISSIHINGWYGTHDKLVGARWIVRELFGRDLDAELERWVYVGDSANDAVMFRHFAHSVGVANLQRLEVQPSDLPHYITQGERGAGFAEMAAHLLRART